MDLDDHIEVEKASRGATSALRDVEIHRSLGA